MSSFKAIGEAIKAGVSAINGASTMKDLKIQFDRLYFAYHDRANDEEIDEIKLQICRKISRLGFFDSKIVIDEVITETKDRHAKQLLAVPNGPNRIEVLGELTLSYTRFREYINYINNFTLEDLKKALDDHYKESLKGYPDWEGYSLKLKDYCINIDRTVLESFLLNRLQELEDTQGSCDENVAIIIHRMYLQDFKKLVLNERTSFHHFNNLLMHHFAIAILNQADVLYAEALAKIKDKLIETSVELKKEFPKNLERYLAKKVERVEKDIATNTVPYFVAGAKLQLELLDKLSGRYTLQAFEHDFRNLIFLHQQLNINAVACASSAKTQNQIDEIKKRQLENIGNLKDKEKAAGIIGVTAAAQYEYLLRVTGGQTFLRHLTDCNKVLRTYSQGAFNMMLGSFKVACQTDVDNPSLDVLEEHIMQNLELFDKRLWQDAIFHASSQPATSQRFTNFLKKFSNPDYKASFRALLLLARNNCLKDNVSTKTLSDAEGLVTSLNLEDYASEVRRAIRETYRLRNTFVRTLSTIRDEESSQKLERLISHLKWLYTFEYTFRPFDIGMCLDGYRTLCESDNNHPNSVNNAHFDLMETRTKQICSQFSDDDLVKYIQPILNQNSERLVEVLTLLVSDDVVDRIKAANEKVAIERYNAFLRNILGKIKMTSEQGFREILIRDRQNCLEETPVLENRNKAKKFELTDEVISEIRGALETAYQMRNSAVRSLVVKLGSPASTRLDMLATHIEWLHTFEYKYTLEDIELCVYGYRSLCEAIGNYPGMLANSHIELVTMRARKVFATFTTVTLLECISPIRKTNKERLATLKQIITDNQDILKDEAKIEKFVLERFESWLDLFKISKPEVTVARFGHLLELSRTLTLGEDKIKEARQEASEIFDKVEGQTSLSVAHLIRKNITSVRQARNQIISSFRVPSVASLGERSMGLVVLRDHLEWVNTLNWVATLQDLNNALEDHLEFIKVAAGNTSDVVQSHRFVITKRASELIKKFNPEVVSDIIYNRINATRTFENTAQTRHDQEMLTEHVKWLEILKEKIVVKNRSVEEYKLIRFRDLLRYYIDDYSHYLSDNHRPANEVTAWRDICEYEAINVVNAIKKFGEVENKKTTEYLLDLVKKTDSKRTEFLKFLNRLVDSALQLHPGRVRSIIEERLINDLRETSSRRWANLLDGITAGVGQNDINLAENAILESRLYNILRDLKQIKSNKLDELIDEQIKSAESKKSGIPSADKYHLDWWKDRK